MLSVNLKDGEYLTIGDDIVVQVVSNANITLYITAPKDKAIVRGKVLEREGGQRPACLFNTKEKKKPKRKKRASAGTSAKPAEVAGREGIPE